MFYDNLRAVCAEKGTTVTTVLKELHMSTGSTGKWKEGSIPKIDTVMVSCLDPEWIDIITHIPDDKQKMCKDFLRTHMVIPEKYADRKRG